MALTLSFLINSILFGVALAMDAFSVSVAAGLANPGIRAGRMAKIAGTFAFFQIAMPLVGWVCVHTVAEKFSASTCRKPEAGRPDRSRANSDWGDL